MSSVQISLIERPVWIARFFFFSLQHSVCFFLPRGRNRCVQSWIPSSCWGWTPPPGGSVAPDTSCWGRRECRPPRSPGRSRPPAERGPPWLEASKRVRPSTEGWSYTADHFRASSLLYLQSRYLFWWYSVKLVTSPCRSPNFGLAVTLAQKRKPHRTSLHGAQWSKHAKTNQGMVCWTSRTIFTHGLLHCSQPWPSGAGPQFPFSVPSALSFS